MNYLTDVFEFLRGNIQATVEASVVGVASVGLEDLKQALCEATAMCQTLPDPLESEKPFMEQMKKKGTKINALRANLDRQVSIVSASAKRANTILPAETHTMLAEGKEIAALMLGVITLQSVIILIRHPNVKTLGAPERQWLSDVSKAFSPEEREASGIRIDREYLVEVDAILGTSFASADVDRPASTASAGVDVEGDPPQQSRARGRGGRGGRGAGRGPPRAKGKVGGQNVAKDEATGARKLQDDDERVKLANEVFAAQDTESDVAVGSPKTKKLKLHAEAAASAAEARASSASQPAV